jgi:hypothetical protein
MELSHDASATSIAEAIAGFRPIILIFLPGAEELQRFVAAGAFNDLVKNYQLHFAAASKDMPALRAAASYLLRPHSIHALDIPEARRRDWCRVLDLSRYVFAERSISFELLTGAKPPRPDYDFWLVSATLARKVRSFLRRVPAFNQRWPRLAMAIKLMPDAADHQERRAEMERLRGQLRPYQPLMDLLTTVAPLFCVLPTSLRDHYCNDVLLAANELHHTVLALQSGWDSLSSEGVLPYPPQCIGVWGPQSVRHAKKIQGVHSAVALGAAQHAALVPSAQLPCERLRADLGVAPDEFLLFFGGSFLEFDETAVLLRLERRIKKAGLGGRKVKVLYRPHPARKRRLKEDNFFDHAWKHVIFDPELEARYCRGKVGHVETDAAMVDMSRVALLLSAADAVMSPISSLLVDALILGKPTMALTFGDGLHVHSPLIASNMTHISDVKMWRALHWCDDGDRFERECHNFVARCSEPGPGDEGPRRQVLDKIVVLGPGTYAQRLTACAQTTVEPLARQRRAKHNRHSIHSAHVVLQDYCQLAQPKPIPGLWMHGWLPQHYNIHPIMVASHKRDGVSGWDEYAPLIERDKQSVPQWVARADQESFLRGHDYQHVKAIGLPFAYLPPLECTRVPGSLLVMPPHGHDNHGPGDPLAEAYAAAIAAKRNEFSEIWVCLHFADYRKREWLSAFQKRHIPVFVGVDQGETRTLLRLKQILSSFEFVTTNGFGSHLAYAAAAGAKLSIFGPFADYPIETMAKCYIATTEPSLTETLVHFHTEPVLRRHYPFLFVEPEKAQPCEEWGRHEIGADIRLDPAELRDLFGWGAPRSSVLAALFPLRYRTPGERRMS